jgi:hypothetical protein
LALALALASAASSAGASSATVASAALVACSVDICRLAFGALGRSAGAERHLEARAAVGTFKRSHLCHGYVTSLE